MCTLHTVLLVFYDDERTPPCMLSCKPNVISLDTEDKSLFTYTKYRLLYGAALLDPAQGPCPCTQLRATPFRVSYRLALRPWKAEMLCNSLAGQYLWVRLCIFARLLSVLHAK